MLHGRKKSAMEVLCSIVELWILAYIHVWLGSTCFDYSSAGNLMTTAKYLVSLPSSQPKVIFNGLNVIK